MPFRVEFTKNSRISVFAVLYLILQVISCHNASKENILHLIDKNAFMSYSLFICLWSSVFTDIGTTDHRYWWISCKVVGVVTGCLREEFIHISTSLLQSFVILQIVVPWSVLCYRVVCINAKLPMGLVSNNYHYISFCSVVKCHKVLFTASLILYLERDC